MRERFWSKVDVRGPDECWPWLAGTSGGYGWFHFGGKKSGHAHRAAFFLTHGHWPRPECLHSCDNTLCVNPAHLREGSHHDNMTDRADRKRSGHYSKPWSTARGSRHGMAKLTEADVPVVLALVLWSGFTRKDVAAEYQVCPQTIDYLVARKTWKHVPFGASP